MDKSKIQIKTNNMKKLSKQQWISFGTTALGFILTTLTENGGAFGFGSRGLAVVGLLTMLYQLYMSFSTTEVIRVAENVRGLNIQNKTRLLEYTPEDVRQLAKK